MATLLAIDAGLRTGLALYGDDGRLRWYRSQNYGAPARLRRAAYGLLREIGDLAWVVVEGGGPLAEAWEKEARRRGVETLRVHAEAWRRELLLEREQRSGRGAKDSAEALARGVIDWSGAARPTSLRHDAAEAILVGLWGVVRVGWLAEAPSLGR